MTTFIVLAFFAVVFLVDYLPFLKQPGEKGKVVYGMLMAASFCVLLLYTLHVPVPSPAEPIRNAIDALFPGLNP